MTDAHRVVLASGNRGKLAELQGALAGLSIELVAQSSLGIESPEETGLTFVENALLKARYASAQSGLPALADDSGLCVDALHGAPGLYSARYAGDAATDADNRAKLLRALTSTPAPERGARFVCVLALLRRPDDPLPLIVQADWAGVVATSERGDGGFGYDPIFLPHDVGGRTAAELTPERKRALSHRGQAVALLQRALGQLGRPPVG
ncbi:MAG: RdgB/HAM1 family non-canonical purine NTP pyrophosphatase [Xanthomonadales bacterium]|nr:RdgB/HAM1 family non-canonical purine NTP pyrophosphatase [Xanthomonadales bacterium]